MDDTINTIKIVTFTWWYIEHYDRYCDCRVVLSFPGTEVSRINLLSDRDGWVNMAGSFPERNRTFSESLPAFEPG